MKSIYITADRIAMGTGGGAVTMNELQALRSVSKVGLVLSSENTDPRIFKQPDSPFLWDYFALGQIKGQAFDIAHLYSGCFSETVRYLKSTGARVSYTIAAHNRRLSIEEFHRLGMEYPFPHIKDDDLWQIYSEGFRLADIVVAPSKKSAQLLKSDGCQKVVVIPHGVNLPQKVKPIPDKFDCCYIGQCGPDKGLVYLIQAWAVLNYPDSRLILAGGGTETLQPFIRQVADRANFVLLGRVEDVSEVYNACSVAIFPSVTEGFGIGILEAMANGRPVIASEGAGASELIDGLVGFTVPIRDPHAIADRIDYLKKNRERIPEMGERARKKARKFTWAKIRQRYCQVWKEE